MDGYNDQGRSSGFNAGGSGNPTGFNFGNVSKYDDARRTRDLFSLAQPGSKAAAYDPYTTAPPASGSRGHASYGSAPPGFGSGAYHPFSFVMPSHLGLSGLNLNARSGYPHINEYEDMLRSEQQHGGIGSSGGAPPVLSLKTRKWLD
jgi:hypothetical protein